MLQIKITTIKLFNKSVLLSERTARDVNKMIAFKKSKIQDNKIDYSEALLEALITLEDALKINFKQVKWYNIIALLWLKKVLKRNYLLEHLVPSQIFHLATMVYTLEGLVTTDKKKEMTKKADPETE